MFKLIPQEAIQKIFSFESGFLTGDFKTLNFFELTPREYLNLAKEDNKTSSKKNMLNAYANTKRAIHCQIDSLLILMGFQYKNINFTKKMNQLNQVGIIGKIILSEINKIRNKLEHDYYLPSEEDVSKAIEIAELFLDATERYLRNYDCIVLGYSEDQLFNEIYNSAPENTIITNELELQYNYTQNEFNICLGNYKITTIQKNNSNYLKLLKHYLLLIKNS